MVIVPGKIETANERFRSVYIDLVRAVIAARETGANDGVAVLVEQIQTRKKEDEVFDNWTKNFFIDGSGWLLLTDNTVCNDAVDIDKILGSLESMCLNEDTYVNMDFELVSNLAVPTNNATPTDTTDFVYRDIADPEFRTSLTEQLTALQEEAKENDEELNKLFTEHQINTKVETMSEKIESVETTISEETKKPFFCSNGCLTRKRVFIGATIIGAAVAVLAASKYLLSNGTSDVIILDQTTSAEAA